jgi:hypothetical protein
VAETFGANATRTEKQRKTGRSSDGLRSTVGAEGASLSLPLLRVRFLPRRSTDDFPGRKRERARRFCWLVWLLPPGRSIIL